MKRRSITTHLIIHGSYTPPEMDIGVEEIRKWHTSPPNNWDDIGYHIVIRRDTTVEFGRPFDIQGAHAPPRNSQSVGICLVGGKDPGKKEWQINYSYPQLARLAFVIDWLQVYYPATIVTGHRDITSGRVCPGFNVAAWWAARRP